MKKLFRIDLEPNLVDIALLITRIGIAAFMLTHGLPKLMMLVGEGPVQFPGIMGMSPEISLFLAVFAEVVCSLFILVGLGTRLAALPLIVTMLVAVFYIHASDPFANQEMGLHYLLAYTVLLLLGSGKFSLDSLIAGRQKVTLRT